MTRIVRTAYRYKRAPGRKKAVALEGPAVVKAAEPAKNAVASGNRVPTPSAIVTIRRRKHVLLAHLLEDITPEEHRRRGDAADVLFREVARRIQQRS
jgi:hypothetical protein